MWKSTVQDVSSDNVIQMDTANPEQLPCYSKTTDSAMESYLVKKYLGDSDSYVSEEESDNHYLNDPRQRKVGSIIRSDIVSCSQSENHWHLNDLDALKILNEFDVGPYDDNDGFDTIDEYEKYLVENHFDLAQRICELDEAPTGPSKRQQQRDRVERLNKMTAAINRTVFEPKAKLPKSRCSARPYKRNFNK